jgi:DNA-binding transcriptional ArsR family regulator
MVNQSRDLGDAFGALADPTRRAILEHLARDLGSPADFATRHGISRPAISRHLRVLERAGFLVRRRRGRSHVLILDPAPLEAVSDWIAHHRAFWERQLDSLERFLDQHAETPEASWQPSTPEREPRSRSSATSRTRVKKSSTRGRTRRS